MGIRKIADIITLDFTTHNPLNGSVQDADLIPTCEIFEDDNDTAILTPTVIKRVSKTGNYRISFDATNGNGFEIGKSYNIIVSATVNSISAKSRIESFVLDSKRINDLNDLAQSQILSDNIPFAGANIDSSISSRASQTSVDAIKTDTESIITTLSTLVVDIWNYTSRTLTAIGLTAADIWTYITRTLTAGTKDAEIDAIKLETDKIQPEIIDNKDAYKADVSLLALEATSQLIKGLLENGTYGLSAIKILIDAIDNSMELQARFDEIKGAGWTVETLKAIKDEIDSLNLELDGVAKETTLNTKASQASVDAVKEVVDEIDLDTSGVAQEATLLLVKAETDKIKFILGLSQENFRIFNPVYNTDNNLLSSTIKIYATKVDCDANTNPIAEYSQIATYNTDKNMTSYRVTKV